MKNFPGKMLRKSFSIWDEQVPIDGCIYE